MAFASPRLLVGKKLWLAATASLTGVQATLVRGVAAVSATHSAPESGQERMTRLSLRTILKGGKRDEGTPIRIAFLRHSLLASVMPDWAGVGPSHG